MAFWLQWMNYRNHQEYAKHTVNPHIIPYTPDIISANENKICRNINYFCTCLDRLSISNIDIATREFKRTGPHSWAGTSHPLQKPMRKFSMHHSLQFISNKYYSTAKLLQLGICSRTHWGTHNPTTNSLVRSGKIGQ